MDRDAFLNNVKESLASISAPRFYATERGFQGALLAQLEMRIRGLPVGTIVEQEHQKRLMQHGLNIRPDIIIHEPYDETRHASRREANLAVIELKLNASEAEAAGDFESLAAMIETLDYPLGVFINVAAARTHAHIVPAKVKGRIVCFAVSLHEGQVNVIEERT